MSFGAGWIVTNAKGDRYRYWELGSPAWTDDIEKATRYARRVDAEAVHAEDEDAWRIIPFVSDPARMVRHRKRGDIYEVLGEAEAQVSTGADGKPIGLGLVRQRSLVERSKLTIYRDPKDGRLFARFPDEFNDGRFEELPVPATEKDGQ